jgi:hypothetical protein
MTTLREAAQQALEALGSSLYPQPRQVAAIAALRAALAEPVQEPVAWLHTDAYNPRVRFLEWAREAKGYRGDWIKTPLYTAPQQRPAEPQEPVATLYGTLPVYDAAPQQRKPLTEGALMGVYIDFDRTADTAWSGVEYLLRWGRAIEAAHGIGSKT